MSRFHTSWHRVRVLLREERASAAAEMAIWSALLIVPIASAADLGIYAYKSMEVQHAAMAGAQAVRQKCLIVTAPPYYTNCTGLAATATAAVQTTGLGSNVTVASGYPTEGYYCPTSSNGLTLMAGGSNAAPSTKPTSCSAGGVPGDYIRVSATYVYSSPFGSVSVAKMLKSPIVQTAWTRMQ